MITQIYTVTCKKCRWVHMGVTRAFAEAEVQRFNEYFATLDTQQRETYYNNKPSQIENYIGCRRCGGTEFRPSLPDDCPEGVTLNPVVYEEKSDG